MKQAVPHFAVSYDYTFFFAFQARKMPNQIEIHQLCFSCHHEKKVINKWPEMILIRNC